MPGGPLAQGSAMEMYGEEGLRGARRRAGSTQNAVRCSRTHHARGFAALRGSSTLFCGFSSVSFASFPPTRPLFFCFVSTSGRGERTRDN